MHEKLHKNVNENITLYAIFHEIHGEQWKKLYPANFLFGF